MWRLQTLKACRKHGGVRVEFENHETWFKVVLSKNDAMEARKGIDSSLKTPQKTLQKTLQKILALIRTNPFVGTQEMADMIGVERSTVARAIAKLKRAGMLRRVGPDKGGHWEIIEE